MRLLEGKYNFYIFLSELTLPFSPDYDLHLSSSHVFGARLYLQRPLISLSAAQVLRVLSVSSAIHKVSPFLTASFSPELAALLLADVWLGAALLAWLFPG